MGHAGRKQANLDDVRLLLIDGRWSVTALADRLGVSRQTVYNYFDELPVQQDEQKRYWIDRRSYISNVALSLEEALELYLAARRHQRQTQLKQKTVAGALRKLARALRQPMTERMVAAANEILEQEETPGEREAVTVEIVKAWANGLVLNLRYRGLQRNVPYDDRFKVYLIEPSPWGDGVYIIGQSEKLGDNVTYKIDRIERASCSGETFKVPENFDERTLFERAWGIWVGEGESVRVRLRFDPGPASRRVRESIWHHSAQRHDLPNGGCELTLDVGEMTELIPWIRSWGPQVEVLEPESLRERMMGEAERLTQLYNIMLPTRRSSIADATGVPMDHFELFLTRLGKTQPPLTIFEHSSDVFQVALYLLEENDAVVTNPHLVKAGAILHDVGKIEQDLRRNQWVHQPHSAKYLEPLLEHRRMQVLLSDNEIDMEQVQYDDLLLICENHHNLSEQPQFLRYPQNRGALLVPVADAIASALESGWLGSITTMLEASPYHNLSLSLLKSYGLAGGLDDEIHRVDLPGDSVADALLNDLIFHDMNAQLRARGLSPILQKGGSLWVVGAQEEIRVFLQKYVVNPQTLYESANLADELFEGVLAAMPAPGAVEPSTIRYLLMNEKITRKVMLGLVDRKRARQALEHFDIPLQAAHEAFGVRGGTLTDKLEAVGESPPYLVDGAQAAYQYHGWRLPPRGIYELLIYPDDFDTWYGYLRDSRIYAGKAAPVGKERERYAEVGVLLPELFDELWQNRVLIDDVAYVAPADLLFRLLGRQTESAVADAVAMLIHQREMWEWDILVATIIEKRMARQFGCLFEVINHEAQQSLIPESTVQALAAVVQDTVGEAGFTFPLRAEVTHLPPGDVPAVYKEIGRHWGLDLLLPRYLVAKIMDDLGV